jgi:hypothetical protein
MGRLEKRLFHVYRFVYTLSGMLYALIQFTTLQWRTL